MGIQISPKLSQIQEWDGERCEALYQQLPSTLWLQCSQFIRGDTLEGTLCSGRLLTITNCIIYLLTEYETPLHGLDGKSNE